MQKLPTKKEELLLTALSKLDVINMEIEGVQETLNLKQEKRTKVLKYISNLVCHENAVPFEEEDNE